VYDRLGKDELSDKYLNELMQAETDFVFPFRAETEHILSWAAEKNNSWKIRYYQALIYWNSGNREKADYLFRSVGDEPGKWEFYIARGNFTLADDEKEAERDYREAYKIAPGEWRTNHKLINFYLSGGFASSALKVSTTAYEKFKGNYIIDFDHACCLLSRDSVYRCIDVLRETNNYSASESYFNKWIEGLADDRVRQWAVSLHEGRYEEAEKYAYMMPDILDKEPWQESIYIADLSLLYKVVKIYLQEKW